MINSRRAQVPGRAALQERWLGSERKEQLRAWEFVVEVQGIEAKRE